MKRLIKTDYAGLIGESLIKKGHLITLLAIDYNWFDISEEDEDFFVAYALVDNNFIEEVYLKGSNNGEMWDLDLEMTKIQDIYPNYSLYQICLADKNLFPRAFVLRGIGSKEYYDNNNGRNYVIKKGRGGNLLPVEDKLIKLNHISLYNIFDK